MDQDYERAESAHAYPLQRFNNAALIACPIAQLNFISMEGKNAKLGRNNVAASWSISSATFRGHSTRTSLTHEHTQTPPPFILLPATAAWQQLRPGCAEAGGQRWAKLRRTFQRREAVVTTTTRMPLFWAYWRSIEAKKTLDNELQTKCCYYSTTPGSQPRSSWCYCSQRHIEQLLQPHYRHWPPKQSDDRPENTSMSRSFESTRWSGILTQ